VTWRSRQTACIHGTELVWPGSLMAQSGCERVHSWYAVDAIWHAAVVILQSHSLWFLCSLYSVHYTELINLADFWKYYVKNPPNLIGKTNDLQNRSHLVEIHQSHLELMRFGKVTYGVKKIRIKWLCPKVTLEVIQRWLKDFWWFCDKKNSRAASLSVRIEWAYSRLSVRMVGQHL
jgi:hypothetical protein